MATTATRSPDARDLPTFLRRYYGELCLKEGREEGREEASLQASRRYLLKLVKVRRLALTARQASLVEQCTDAALLERWHDRLLEGASLEQAFATETHGAR